MNSFFWELGHNKILWVTLSSWAIAQALKVALGVLREKRFNFRWFLRSGGMPSSHTALSMCLTACVGLEYGYNSGLFAVALCLAAITMFDAQGVRRHSGRQAIILNQILDDIYAHKEVQQAKLKELLGHTPIEVFAGGFLGIVVALYFYR
jgi:uncharacterized protein